MTNTDQLHNRIFKYEIGKLHIMCSQTQNWFASPQTNVTTQSWIQTLTEQPHASLIINITLTPCGEIWHTHSRNTKKPEYNYSYTYWGWGYGRMIRP